MTIGVALAGLRLAALGRVPSRALTLILIPLSFWIIAGVERANTRVGSVILTFTGERAATFRWGRSGRSYSMLSSLEGSGRDHGR